MNLLYVTDARLPTEKAHGLQIMKTCEALVRHGCGLELIAPMRANPIRDDPFVYYGIAPFPFTKRWTLDLVRFGRIGFLIQEMTFSLSAARYVRKRDGIIYGRDEVVLAILYLFTRRKIIWESHTGAWNACARYIVKRAVAVVVISHGLKSMYEGRGIPSAKITVAPSAIDLAQFSHPEEKADARDRLHLPQDKKIAMYIGRLDGWKGTATLLEASKLFHAGLLLAMIGGEPGQVEELSSQYPRVRFLGFRPYGELSDNQAAADVLVVPNTGKDAVSARFTSPLKLVAHMASGRPVVASDLPSIRELSGDDAALLVTPDDPAALAHGIERALSDSMLSEQLVKQAHNRVQRYSWEARAEAIVSLCQAI